MKVNSNPVDSFPYTTSDDLITITYTPSEPRYKYKVQLPNAVNIKWDGIKDVLIEVGLSFYDGTRGKIHVTDVVICWISVTKC